MSAHGTRARYKCGCRCASCRAAQADYQRRWRATGRAVGSPAYLRDLERARRRKWRYGGTCSVCGAATTSAVCFRCSAREIGYMRRGTGPVSSRVLEKAASGQRQSEIASELGISYTHVSVTINRLMRYGMLERVARGRYRDAG